MEIFSKTHHFSYSLVSTLQHLLRLLKPLCSWEDFFQKEIFSLCINIKITISRWNIPLGRTCKIKSVAQLVGAGHPVPVLAVLAAVVCEHAPAIAKHKGPLPSCPLAKGWCNASSSSGGQRGQKLASRSQHGHMWKEQGWLCQHQRLALAELWQLCEHQLCPSLFIGGGFVGLPYSDCWTGACLYAVGCLILP